MSNIKEDQIMKLHTTIHDIYKNFKKVNSNIESELFQGITSIEISIIGTIGSTTDIRLKDICEELQLSASTMTSAIDRLEKRKLLKRVISEKDRRSFVLELTNEGLNLFKKHRDAEKVILGAVLDALEDDRERETFINSLEKISKRI